MSERERALQLGLEDPILPTIEATHNEYDAVIDDIMKHISENPTKRAEVLVATHNQASIEKAVDRMAHHGIPSMDGGVYFGQLLGMADHLTFGLAHDNYNVYKYLPFG